LTPGSVRLHYDKIGSKLACFGYQKNHLPNDPAYQKFAAVWLKGHSAAMNSLSVLNPSMKAALM
jgi:hypothetical protein